jgi:hypothetical protein
MYSILTRSYVSTNALHSSVVSNNYDFFHICKGLKGNNKEWNGMERRTERRRRKRKRRRRGGGGGGVNVVKTLHLLQRQAEDLRLWLSAARPSGAGSLNTV